jgi:plasmid stabilization system protein ParE
MRLIWAPEALRDLARLHGFLIESNPAAANRAIRAIREGIRILRDNPEIGRPVDGLDLAFRERLIAFGAGVYVVRYRVDDGAVVLLAVRHGRELGF